jgi:hypothetical protein
MTRTQTILAGLLALQAAAIFLVHEAGGSTAPPERRPLFEGLDDLAPARLEVQGSEADKKVTLVREGDAWAIEESGRYPADAEKVQKLIESLGDLQVRRPVVTSSRYHKALKVTDAEHERHLRIYAAGDDDPEVDLYVGTSPNYRTTHVRRADDDPVYEVAGLGAYDIRDTPSGWINTRLVDVKFDDVTGIRVQNKNGAFQLERMADGAWRLASGREMKLDKAEVDSLVRSAAAINAADPEGPIDRPAQGLEPAAATVTLFVREPAEEKEEGDAAAEAEAAAAPEGATAPVREITIWIGKEVPDKDSQRYVAYSDFGFTARAWKGSLDRLVDAKLDDLKPEKKAAG